MAAVLGCNGNARSNMLWHPGTGLFVYSSGCVVVVENLHDGRQRHLVGHIEEVSTLSLQHDCQVSILLQF